MRRAWDRKDPQEPDRGRRPNLNDVAERSSVPLTPLPYMSTWTIDEQRQEWRRLVEIGRQRAPTPPNPMGVEKLLQQDPHTRPKKTKNSPAPYAHYTEQGALEAWQEAYKLYEEAFYVHTDIIAEMIDAEESQWAYPVGGVTPIQLPRTCRDCQDTDRPKEPDRSAA